MSDTEANKATVKAFFEHFSNCDWDGVRAQCDPDFRWVVPTIGKLQSKTLAAYSNIIAPSDRGLEETIEMFQLTHDGCVDGKFATWVTSIIAEGDQIAAEGESHAVSKATGKVYTNKYSFHLQMRGGKIAEFREYQDTLHVFDVWGVE